MQIQQTIPAKDQEMAKEGNSVLKSDESPQASSLYSTESQVRAFVERLRMERDSMSVESDGQARYSTGYSDVDEGDKDHTHWYGD
jgi:hypothetical protein